MKESKAAFARRLGVDRSYVTRLGHDGRLVFVDGLVDVEASQARLAATQDPAREDVRKRHAAQRGSSAPVAFSAGGGQRAVGPGDAEKTPKRPDMSIEPRANEDINDEVTTDDGGSRTRYKRLIIGYENQTTKLEMALRRGLRYDRRGWVESVGAVGGVMRAGGERLIDQGAPSLALLSNDADRMDELLRYVARYRSAVKREFPRALRRQRTAAQGGGGL